MMTSRLSSIIKMLPSFNGSNVATNQSVNMTLDEYLVIKLGPQRLDLGVLVPITLVYGIILISGLVGNVCTCLVITGNKHMHTATNYYLFNLAVADVLTLILGLPNDLSVYWRQYPYLFGEVVCKTRAMISEMTNYASVLTIVAFTTERYVAICHPFKAHKLSDLTRVLKTIAFLWIIACICATPFAIFTTVHHIDFPEGSGQELSQSAFCAIADKDNNHNRYVSLFLSSFLVFFIVPLIIIIVLYVNISIHLRQSKMCRQISDSSSTSDGTIPSRKVVVNMLVAVVISFFICWAPFHAQRLFVVYVQNNKWNYSLRKINETLYYVGGCCYYINCTTNPILYNVMSKKYRHAFERTLNCRRSRGAGTSGAFRHSICRLSSGNFSRGIYHSDSVMMERDRFKISSRESRLNLTAATFHLINSSLETGNKQSSRHSNCRPVSRTAQSSEQILVAIKPLVRRVRSI